MESQHLLVPETKIENLNFTQILQQALQTRNLNYYALALAKSRNAQPDHNTISLTLQLFEIGGNKWAEVLQRQALNNYALVYSIACQNTHALEVLVGLASEQQHKEQLKSLCVRILQAFQLGLEVWSAFYVLLKVCIEMKDQQYKFQLLSNINKLIEVEKLTALLQSFATKQLSAVDQVFKEYVPVTFFKIYTAIIRLYSSCAKYAVKKGQYASLRNLSQPLTNYFFEIFNHTLTFLHHHSSQIQANTQHYQLKQTLISNALQCLQQLAKIPQLELSFIDNGQDLVKVLMSLPLLREANTVQDRLNFEYGLSVGQFGEDVQSLLAQTIIIISERVPLLLRQFLLQTNNRIANQSDTTAVGLGLVLLPVISKLVVVRDDLAAQIVTPLLQYLVSSSTQQTPLEVKCRIQRVLLFYGEIITEQQYHHLLTTTLNLLDTQPCKSFAFHQADNIFQIFTQKSSASSKVGRLATFIKQSLNHAITKLLDIIAKTSQVPSPQGQEKCMRLVKLIRILLDTNQRQVSQIAVKVMKNSMSWLLSEVTKAWQKRIKHTVLIYELAVLLKQAVFLVDMEQNYVNGGSDQLYKVFQLLKYPERLEIADQIISILHLKIEKEAIMDSRLCQTIVTSLQSLVVYEKGNLGVVSNILKALNNSELAGHIIYEWDDLIIYLGKLYINYFSNYLNQNYLNLYSQQLNEVASFFQKYLQIYEPYFDNHPEVKSNLFEKVQEMPSCEWKIRFFLVLHHQDREPRYDFFNLQQASKCMKRGTMKLIFFYYIDKLLRSYNETTVNDLLAFNKMFEEKKLRRAFQEEPIQGIPYPQINLKTYIYQGIRQLRKNNNLDLIQYSFLLQQFKLE